MNVELVTRATVERTAAYVRRIWRSRCGRFRVSEFRRCDGIRVFYAEAFGESPTGGCWDVVSRHRKRGAAVEAVKQAAAKAGR